MPKVRLKVGGFSMRVSGNKAKAKAEFKQHFPLVIEKDLDLELDKLFGKNENQSNNTKPKIEDSSTADTEISKGKSGKEQVRKD